MNLVGKAKCDNQSGKLMAYWSGDFAKQSTQAGLLNYATGYDQQRAVCARVLVRVNAR